MLKGNTLLCEHVATVSADQTKGDDAVNDSSVQHPQNSFQRQKSNILIPGNDESSEDCDDDSDDDCSVAPNNNTVAKKCQICLIKFRVGDQIGWSPNPNCIHTFHMECLEAWLMEKDQCPLCRHPYLAVGPVAEQRDSDGHEHHATPVPQAEVPTVVNSESSALSMPWLGNIARALGYGSVQQSRTTPSSHHNTATNASPGAIATSSTGDITTVQASPTELVQQESNTSSSPGEFVISSDIETGLTK